MEGHLLLCITVGEERHNGGESDREHLCKVIQINHNITGEAGSLERLPLPLPPTKPRATDLRVPTTYFLNLAVETIHYGEQIFLNCRGRSKGGWKLKLCRAREPPSSAR